MKKILIAGMAMTAALYAGAAEINNPLWLRNPAVSPDGKTVAFTYRGDVYTVPTAGGQARQLTTSPAYDTAPVWSPDGGRILFASDREGSLDLFIIDAAGGTPLRLTTNTASETPLAFLNDTTVIYSSGLQPSAEAAMGPFQAQVYTVSTTPGSRPALFMSLPAMRMNVDGKNIIYQDRKTYEDPLRKHERSAGTSDIWTLTLGDDMKATRGKFAKLTSFNGPDQSPVWNKSVPGEYFYVSEEDGTLNVYRANVNGPEKQQLTRFTTHPVRTLSASADGKTLVFTRDGQLYSMTPGGEPAVIPVSITADLYTPEAAKSVLRNGASSISVSPSGEEIAFVARGNVYVTARDFSTTRQITSTPEQERVVAFSPDGKSLVYDSERDGIWQLFTAKIKNPEEELFTYATEIEETPLYKSVAPAFQPAFSPDGKKVAFLEDRTALRVLDIASKKVVTALPDSINYSYEDGDMEFEWSPDSRWLLSTYMGNGGWNNPDIALVAADGTKVVDLTRSGYNDNNPHWAMDGKALIWASDRNGYRNHGSWGTEEDVYIMFLDGEAYDLFNRTEEEIKLADRQKEKEKEKEKESDEKDSKDKKSKKARSDAGKDGDKKPLEFDLANARHRTKRLTAASSQLGEFFLDRKGEKLYYINADGLWSRDLQEGDMKILVKGVDGLVPTPKGDALIVSAEGSLSLYDLEHGTSEPIAYEAPLALDRAAEREYMYDHMLRQVRDKFYDPSLHGVDWEMYGKEYRKFLPHITNNYDFAEMLSEILGELNASHTGGRYRPKPSGPATADLGAFFDQEWTGDGIRIAEILPTGPLDSKEGAIKAGEIITSIDGQKILAGKDYYPLLEGKAGKKIRLGVKGKDGKERTVFVKPVSSSFDLLYRRWVERNRAMVDSISGGKIAYVHVKEMDSPSFRAVFEEMLGPDRNRDAIVVDTRFNGGGWLHNDLAILLNGKEYVRFAPRGRYIGSEPFTQWYKPSVLLVNEGNYSDGHGSAYVYKTLGLGEIIGAPIPGTMTAVWWENQIDPSVIFGIPQTTALDMTGKPLENQQLEPDIVIYNAPGDALNGIDTQLEGAVKRLLQKN